MSEKRSPGPRISTGLERVGDILPRVLAEILAANTTPPDPSAPRIDAPRVPVAITSGAHR